MHSLQIGLKPGFHIYSVSAHFAKQIYMMPGGFTSYDIFFAVARSAGEAEELVALKDADKDIEFRKLSAQLACKQDIRRYCFADTFAGFAEGC